MDAAFTAHEENRDDVGMVELCGGMSLVFEPLQLLRVHHGSEWQHLERDAAAERDLLGLVDDAHAAAADLADDAEVAEDSCGGLVRLR
jgi:hypothetical protein